MVTSLAAFVARLATRSQAPTTRPVSAARRASDAVVVANSLAVGQGGVPVLVLDDEHEERMDGGPTGDPAVGSRLNLVA